MDRVCGTCTRLVSKAVSQPGILHGVRKVLNIPYRAHTWMLGPLMNPIHVKDKMYNRDLKYICDMKISDNNG